MEVLHPRCAGLDVHKETVVACVRLAEKEKVTRSSKRFGTTTRELFRLREWLESHRVTHVTMESTGVYWKPVWHVLEGGFKLVLGNAKEMRNVPGRKTDQSDASWIADLMAHGLIRASFVPPEPIQELRDLTRTRKQLVRERARHVQRIQQVLEDANIKLGSVLSDLQGMSGRAILEGIIGGIEDPKELAKRAHPRVKASQTKIAEALQGTIREHHRFMLRLYLKQIDALDDALEAVDGEIEQKLSPFREEIALLETAPGISATAAAAVVAETGADMSQFPSAEHLVSWAGLSPQQNESAGKRKSSRTKRQRWLKTMLVQAAHAAVKKKDTYLQAKYRRIKSRRGSKKAILAIAATLAKAIYYMLKRRVPYEDLGPDFFEKRDRERTIRSLKRRLERLGVGVELKAAA